MLDEAVDKSPEHLVRSVSFCCIDFSSTGLLQTLGAVPVGLRVAGTPGPSGGRRWDASMRGSLERLCFIITAWLSSAPMIGRMPMFAWR